jgi:hypothetical protein
VVQRAVVQTTQPLLDPTFDDRSHGYRPRHNRGRSLALAESLARQEDRWVWVTEDIKDAFDQVPQKRLLDVIRRQLPSKELARLIKRVVTTDTGKGIRQGGSLSSLLLNVYLDHFLDKSWRKQHPDTPLIRVADDLLVLCQSTQEAGQAYTDLGRTLQAAGMPLKGTKETTTRNLATGHDALWLGFRLVKEANELKAHIGTKSWRALHRKLEETHRQPNAPLRAAEVVLGWASQMGPCWPQVNVREAYARIASLAISTGHEEFPSRETLTREWERAYHRHTARRQAYSPTGETGQTGVSGGGSA